MIEPNEAFEILWATGISAEVIKLPIELTSGKTLAEDIVCDHDLPPFDRVMMDGFAVQFDALSSTSLFKISAIQRAGIPPLSLKSEIECVEVMTGCVLPEGCDTVVPVEFTERDGDLIQITQKNLVRGQNIHKRAQDHTSGDVLVRKGSVIHAGIAGIAASCGMSELRVYGIESAAILSTGDELVDIPLKPEAWQIRKSNSHVLSSILHSLGIPHRMDHSADEIDQLSQKILSHSDVKLLLITGAVSRGKFDLVPQVLQSLGYNVLFHKVRQKPGKPLLAAMRNNQLVIALPGNPVSVLACACRYIIPLLSQAKSKEVVISTDLQFKVHPFTQFIPVKRRFNSAEAIAWNGSGDFASIATADGFVEIPAGCEVIPQNLDFYRIP
jgi:molybdopterin molybdotransferase